MENKDVNLMVFAILCVLISAVRHFLEDGILKFILTGILLLLTFMCLRNYMTKGICMSIKVVLISMLANVAAYLLVVFKVISLYVFAVIVCISVSIALIVSIVQWVLAVKSLYK